jgi:DNA-directed RNA polymerase specialized sigma24 family protein
MKTKAKSMNANLVIGKRAGACLPDESPCKLNIADGKVKRRKRGKMSTRKKTKKTAEDLRLESEDLSVSSEEWKKQWREILPGLKRKYYPFLSIYNKDWDDVESDVLEELHKGVRENNKLSEMSLKTFAYRATRYRILTLYRKRKKKPQENLENIEPEFKWDGQTSKGTKQGSSGDKFEDVDSYLDRDQIDVENYLKDNGLKECDLIGFVDFLSKKGKLKDKDRMWLIDYLRNHQRGLTDKEIAKEMGSKAKTPSISKRKERALGLLFQALEGEFEHKKLLLEMLIYRMGLK